MSRRLALTLFIAILGLFVGSGVGGYITYNRVMRTVQNIPASPIVVGAEYDKDNNRLVFSVLNPGTLPLSLDNYSIAFTPGESTQQQAYFISNIPLGITINPMEVAVVYINLKEQALPLEIGDIVTTTIFYSHPLSPDVYTVVHPFVYEKKGESPSDTTGGKK